MTTTTYELQQTSWGVCPVINGQPIIGADIRDEQSARAWLAMVLTNDEIDQVFAHFEGRGELFVKNTDSDSRIHKLSPASRQRILDALRDF